MEFKKNRQEHYEAINQLLEDVTIKDKDEVYVEIEAEDTKEVKQSESHVPQNDSYIIEIRTEDITDYPLFNITLDSSHKQGDLIYLKKMNEPLIICLVYVSLVEKNGEFKLDVIDYYDPPINIESIEASLEGEII